MLNTPNLWLPCLDPDAVMNAKIRLFCLPHAGAGASLFYQWSRYLPGDVAVCPLQLPGREERWEEQSYTDFSSLIPAIATAMQPYLDRPFALFGHSMGAVIAYELARYLHHNLQCNPIHLFVSGAPAPHVQRYIAETHTLPDTEFLAAIQQHYGGFSSAQLQEPELLQFLLPTLRADFHLIEHYLYAPGKTLNCPLTAISGQQDPFVNISTLSNWHVHTTGPFYLYRLPGDHFFLRHTQIELMHLFSGMLTYVPFSSTDYRHEGFV